MQNGHAPGMDGNLPPMDCPLGGPRIREYVINCVEPSPHRFILDLRRVTFMDSQVLVFSSGS
ncbi:hypothetical protein GCM10010377_42410 [Streptomyces viridiviolaceus]|nr:hypothetical protein GCM10010377_42410 [Streptomyces viridiviolaceus]